MSALYQTNTISSIFIFIVILVIYSSQITTRYRQTY